MRGEPIPGFELDRAEAIADRVSQIIAPPQPVSEREDVRQEALLKVVRYWTQEAYDASPASERGVAFEAWLYVRVLGDVRDVYKKEYRRRKARRKVTGLGSLSFAGFGKRGLADAVNGYTKSIRWERRRGISNGDEAVSNDYSFLAVPRPPDEVAEREDRRMTIQAALDRLPETQRFVTQRVYLDGYTQAEVAAELGVSQPAVSKMLDRAKTALARLLNPENV